MEKIGVELRPRDKPRVPPLELVRHEDWDSEGEERAEAAGFVSVVTLPFVDLTGCFGETYDASGQRQILRQPVLVEGFVSLNFTEFKLWAPCNYLYSRLLRNAIHEGAHILQDYNLMGDRNKIATHRWLSEQRKRHGQEFLKVDRELARRARDLGLWRPWSHAYVPKDLADCFQSLSERK